MATLTQFLGPTSGTLEIYLYVSSEFIGTGTVTSSNEFELTFSGSYSFLGDSGQINFSIALTDQDPNSTSGTCTIVLNDDSDSGATYTVDATELVITTSLQEGTQLFVYPYENGTEIDDLVIPGHNPHDIWIGPDSSVLKGKCTCNSRARKSKSHRQYHEDRVKRY